MRKPFEGNYPLSQTFGGNPESYAKFGMKGHNGLDYATPTGTNILAPHSGKVIEVSYDETGYGLYIKIENDKEGSVLAHLKENYVSIGATVTEGQLIASSNNTGNSTGPHLHWGYYTFPRNRQNGYAGFIDQLPLITQPKPPVQEDKDKIITDLKATVEELKKQIGAKDQAIAKIHEEYGVKLSDQANKCQIIIDNTRNSTIDEVRLVVDKLKK